MKKPTALNPVSTPLNSTVLIEASAGTGKTYTMASLYLRLLLQAGQNNFPQPLSVEQILVVTFTEAATQELKERIRQRIHLAKQQLTDYRDNRDKSVFIGTDNEILAELVDFIEDLDLAVQRLHFSEQNMDLAAIYTIHGFCRRMLMQYAFNSGIHFDLELVKDETELLTHLSRECWRQNFYNLPLSATNFIHHQLKSPESVLNIVRSHLASDTLKTEINQPHFLELSLQDFIKQYILENQSVISQFKRDWLANEAEIREVILTEITRDYAKGEKKRLKRNPYNAKNTPNWLNLLKNWVQNDYDAQPPEQLFQFAQSKLEKYTEEGAEPLTHPLFQRIDEIATIDWQLYKKVVLYHYIQWVKRELNAYKNNHKQKSFDDLLRLLNQALQSSQGEELARLIRHQYPFAMIDEFQDTDAQQYEIFHKIYIDTQDQNTGFIMIGDPKQAIYQFRGADIFTYLNAAKQAEFRFTLGKNYRSQRNLVETINALFDFAEPPAFLYQNIDFLRVSAQKEQPEFYLNGQIQPPLVCYVGDKSQLAKVCAHSIQQWLKSAVENQAVLSNQPLQAKDITVLVSDGKEAALIKQALSERGIASVYLSDKSNVFDSKEARELALILAACLNPFSERNILNALATGVFALTSAQIQQIKQNERLLEDWVSRFEKYRRLWQWQGVLPMLYALLLEKDGHNETNIPEKLFAQPNGERRLTDFLHLAELLQQAAELHESEAALLRWFERQIQGDDRQEGQEIRLESERQLVKIVTIHKSKGLEYGLVWLPFIAFNRAWKRSDIVTYYNDETQKIHWDINNLHNDEAQKEYYAEQMRLLYVALTRAKYQLVLGLPAEFGNKWNNLLYALTQGEIGTQEKHEISSDAVTLLEGLKEKIGESSIDVRQISDIQFDDWRPSDDVGTELRATQFTGQIERNWTISSFTALTAMHAKNKEKAQRREVGLNGSFNTKSAVENSVVFDEAADYDKDIVTLPKNEENTYQNNMLEEKYSSLFPVGCTPFDFPQGIRVGLALHSFFERHDFNRSIEAESLHRLCQHLRLEESWLAPLQQWLELILKTPLFAEQNFALQDITKQDCLKEMQFYLHLKQDFDVGKFNKLLQQYHKVIHSEPLLLEQIKGMVRGFIDLVFRHNGKYYLLDYKSNLLGTQLADYARDKLSGAMRHNHYDLQYLLYSLALHRYLRQRDATYCYEKHFGGVIYTFIRGMNGENSDYGVFFDCPDVCLIEELDNLFYA